MLDQPLPPTDLTVKSLTVLTDPKNIQVKRITPEAVHAAVSGEWFYVEQLPFYGLVDLHKIIIGLTKHQLVIHAGRTTTQPINGMVRVTRHKHRRTGELPFFADRPSPTLTIDLDNTPIPPGCTWSNPRQIAELVWKSLQNQSPMLQGVGCIWRTSGSAGIEGREHIAKLHFTVILGAPLLWHDRKTVLAAIPGADQAMARVVQKHYLAGRVVEGMEDPLANVQTDGVIDGSPLWYNPTPKPVENPFEIDVQISEETTEFGRSKLSEICQIISAAQPGTRHNTVRDLSYLIGGYVGGGEIAELDAYESLRASVVGFKDPKHHWHTISDSVPAGIDKPRSNVADWATDVLTRDFNVEHLATYALTLEPDQRLKLEEMIDELCQSKVAKRAKNAIELADSRREAERSRSRYSQLCAQGGFLSKYVKVLDAGDAQATPIAYDTVTGARRKFSVWRELTSPLGTVATVREDGKIVQTPVGQVWWDDDHTMTFDQIKFDPTQPVHFTDRQGRQCLNSYRQEHHKRAAVPDARQIAPFIHLLKVNFPKQHDQDALLSMLAAAVQFPGRRLGYGLVVQGVQGCGKNQLIEETLKYCLGSRYIAKPRPDDLVSQNNGFMADCLVCIADEAGVRKYAARHQIEENLKELITADEIYIVDKYIRGEMRRIFAAWFFLTNNLETMFGSGDDERRYMFLVSALDSAKKIHLAFHASSWEQYPEVAQHVTDKDNWFAYYVMWFRYFGGGEAIRGYLQNYPVVAQPGRAPRTVYAESAKKAAYSDVERVVYEALENEDVGFGGEFVSSNAVRQLLKSEDLPNLQGRAQGHALHRLGYKWSKRVRMVPSEDDFFPTGATESRLLDRKFTIYTSNEEFAIANKSGTEWIEAYQDHQRKFCEGIPGFGKNLDATQPENKVH